MAIVLLGTALADARGKVGGIVFSRNAAGHYVRTKISPVQPNTSPQQAIRAAMTTVTQAWRDTLSAAERAAWEDYAQSTPIVDRLGNRKTRSGISMFSRFNSQWVRVGGSLVTAAPTTPGEAAMETVTLTGNTTDGIKAAAPVPALSVGDKLMVYACSAPVTQARNSYTGPFTYRTVLISTDTFPKVIVPNTELSVGQRWFFRFRLFTASGRVGPASFSYVDITA